MSCVLDASALVFAVRSTEPSASIIRQRLVDETTHAPHLIDAEVGNVLRRQVLASELSQSDARTLLSDAATLVDMRYETSEALRGAAWALRDNVSFYDALYVALGQALDLSLLTADARLMRAPKLPCAVELVTSARARPGHPK
ncbi:MAG: type II toxin-antitoxin system VapC family toxin [Solirubrobacteraceae bacterium]